VQKYDTGKTKYSLHKEFNLTRQEYMTQETAAQKIRNQLKSSTEHEKIQELKGNQCMDNSNGNLKDRQ
jgi:hypothetical protein